MPIAMNIEEVEQDPELRQVLWACYEYWKNEPIPPNERLISFNLIIETYRKKFGSPFHQTKLYWLAKYGFLTQAHTVRGGGRRYYKLVDHDKILGFLQKWNLV